MFCSEYRKAVAMGFYETDRIARFCVDALLEIKRRREEMWEEEIKEYINRKQELSKKWYAWFVHIPTREEAIEILKNDSSYTTTWNRVQWSWEDHADQIKKISALCSTCNSRYIKLDDKSAVILKSLGLGYGEKTVDGI